MSQVVVGEEVSEVVGSRVGNDHMIDGDTSRAVIMEGVDRSFVGGAAM